MNKLPTPQLDRVQSLDASSERSMKVTYTPTTKLFIRLSVGMVIAAIFVLYNQQVAPGALDYVDEERRITLPVSDNKVCDDVQMKLDECLHVKNKRPDQCMPYYDTLRQCMYAYTRPDKIQKAVASTD